MKSPLGWTNEDNACFQGLKVKANSVQLRCLLKEIAEEIRVREGRGRLV